MTYYDNESFPIYCYKKFWSSPFGAVWNRLKIFAFVITINREFKYIKNLKSDMNDFTFSPK